MTSASKTFRSSFKVSKELLNWYPGHMKFSFTHMQAKMRMIDCIVEVHDSRIPISGRNPLFLKSLVGSKPHILVLNKKDLIDKSNKRLIRDKFMQDNLGNLVFTNCLDQKCSGLNSLIPLVIDLIKGSLVGPREKIEHKMMVVGVPNVGKSSLINALRNINLSRGKATAVGAIAGVTRSVQNEVKVSLDPLIYLIDTPGILLPKVSDTECGMKLALCSCLKDEVVGLIVMADFLLYWMNKVENFSYVDYFNIREPIDEIFPLLVKIAVDENKMKRVKNIALNTLETVPDVYSSAQLMVSLFRKGKFGDLGFDREYL